MSGIYRDKLRKKRRVAKYRHRRSAWKGWEPFEAPIIRARPVRRLSWWWRLVSWLKGDSRGHRYA